LSIYSSKTIQTKSQPSPGATNPHVLDADHGSKACCHIHQQVQLPILELAQVALAGTWWLVGGNQQANK